MASRDTYISLRQDETDATTERLPSGVPPQSSIPRKPVGCLMTTTSSHNSERKLEEQQPQRTPSSSRISNKPNLFHLWWFEIICCVLVVASLFAIVAIVYPYHNRPLPQWPYRLSINSLIAVFIVILKAAMLLVTTQGLSQLKWTWFQLERPLRDLAEYDSASRGPVGCLSLLWNLRGRNIVASCGAFITVAALIIDPFAQQMIEPYNCMTTNASAAAILPRTNYWADSTLHQSPGYGISSFPVQSSVVSGVFSPGQQVEHSCATGNCTFAQFHSLGYCSSCTDATSELSYKPERLPETWNMSFPTKNIWGDTTMHALIGENNGSLTNDVGSKWPYLNLNSYSLDNVNLSMHLVTDIVMAATWYNVSTSGSCPDHCKTGPNINKAPECLQWGCPSYTTFWRGVPLEAQVGAARCSLYPCVRTYNASVVTGQLSETLVSTNARWGVMGPEYVAGGMLDIACLPSSDLQNLATAGYSFPAGTKWLPYGNTSVPQLISDFADKHCFYEYPSDTTSSLNEYLSSLFLTGAVIPGGYGSFGEHQGSMQLEALYNDSYVTMDRITSTWRNISDALTIHIRQNGVKDYSSPVLGQAHNEQTCARVRWAFLAYPAVLVVLTLVFFTAMITETRKVGNDWKSSSFALLFHGLETEDLQRAGGESLTHVKDMEDVAARLRVRLQDSGHASRLVGSRNEKQDTSETSDSNLKRSTSWQGRKWSVHGTTHEGRQEEGEIGLADLSRESVKPLGQWQQHPPA